QATGVSFEDDIARYGSIPTPSINSTAACSVSVWYKPDKAVLDFATNHGSGIVEKTVGGVVNRQWLLYHTPSLPGLTAYNGIIFRCINTGLTMFDAYFPVTTEDVGRWMHLVGVFDGATVSLYKNGILQMSAPFTGTLNTGSGDLLIGKLGSSAYPCQ